MQINRAVNYKLQATTQPVPPTGHESGGCISIQAALGRPLLWFACRHHMAEIMLTQVWNDLKIEASQSPDISIFKR